MFQGSAPLPSEALRRACNGASERPPEPQHLPAVNHWLNTPKTPKIYQDDRRVNQTQADPPQGALLPCPDADPRAAARGLADPARRTGRALGRFLPAAACRARHRGARAGPGGVARPRRQALRPRRPDHGHRRRPCLDAGLGSAAGDVGRAFDCRCRAAGRRTRIGGSGRRGAGERRPLRPDAGQADALDHRHPAGAFRPVAVLPGRGRHHRRLGRLGRRGRRGRLDPCLRDAAGQGSRRHHGQCVGADIFCSRLEAELLAIDGFYKTAEDMEPELRGKAVQIWLEGETFKVGSIA